MSVFSRCKSCKPLNTPNAMNIHQWGKQIKMCIKWRNYSLKNWTTIHDFADRLRSLFGCLKNLKDNTKVHWNASTAVGWGWEELCEHVTGISEVMKCHSTDSVHYTLTYLPLTKVSSEPLFFPIHTPNSGHNCVLQYRQVELKLQDTAFPHSGNAQRIQT